LRSMRPSHPKTVKMFYGPKSGVLSVYLIGFTPTAAEVQDTETRISPTRIRMI